MPSGSPDMLLGLPGHLHAKPTTNGQHLFDYVGQKSAAQGGWGGVTPGSPVMLLQEMFRLSK